MSARIAARIAGVKGVVHTKHCIDETDNSILSSVKRKLIGHANNYFSNKVIAVSMAVRENLIEAGVKADKIVVIYNGINELDVIDDSEKAQTRNLLGISEDELVVGIFARLETVKGHDYFIEAAKLVMAKFEPVKFIIAGTGALENQLKELVKKEELENKIIFTGHLEDITKIMNILDINVISSVSEALCLSLIEGMSLAKPSVATLTGGIPEVVIDRENGFLVPVKSADEMAEAILRLCNDHSLREKMGEAGREIMRVKFSTQEMIKKIQAIYEELGRGK